MEPTSILIASSILLLVATVGVAAKRKAATANIKAARTRASRRQSEREYLDTEPMCFYEPIEFTTSVQVSDNWDTHGFPLSREQHDTINLIMEGFSPPAKHDSVKTYGPTALAAGGAPINAVAFDSLNRVATVRDIEYIDSSALIPAKYSK